MIGVAQPSGEHVIGARFVRVLALAAAIAVGVVAMSAVAAASRADLSAPSSKASVYSMTVQRGPIEFWSGPSEFWSGPTA